MTSDKARLKTIRRGWRALPALLLVAVAAACGGGGGGSTATPPTTPAAGFGTASKVAVGTITGFGSVHLNGRKFETTSATIKVNGQAATQADLHVGDVVEVKGHHDSATNTDIADEIEFHSNVQGPVSSVDATAQTLVVLGQNVVVSADTSFDDSIQPASLASIAVGDILEVSGMPTASGDLLATRIERKPAGTAFQVSGTAAATDATAKTLRINALTVDFAAATLVDFPSAGPQDGDAVEARGTTLGAAGELKATRLELRSGKQLKPDDAGSAEFEGLITRFASATDFDVAGRAVSTSAATTFDGGTAADLALNVRVEAEGTVDSAGVLAATKVQVRHAADTRILAQADAVDATAGTLRVLGVTVSTSDMTRFEDHSSQKVNTFKVADVHTGDWLEIRGAESPAGSGVILATRFERVGAQQAVRLSGVVAAAAQPSFTVLGVTVATTTGTQLRAGDGGTGTADAFFTGLVGKTVAVRGSWDGTTLMATEASLGEHGDDGGED